MPINKILARFEGDSQIKALWLNLQGVSFGNCVSLRSKKLYYPPTLFSTITFTFNFSSPNHKPIFSSSQFATSISHGGKNDSSIIGDAIEEVPMKETNRRKKSNKCNQCEYASSWVSALKTHVKIHNVERPKKCNQCNYASCRASSLRRHLKTHSGEKLNKCNQCDFASSRADHLRRHLKTHSGEKSNKCNHCDFVSPRAGDLKRHLQTHSGEKSNKCNQCDFSSSRADHLRRHLKTHSNETV